jgi:hypothetical protein
MRTPNGLVVPDRETLAELFQPRPERPITMPPISGGVAFAAKMASELFLTDPEYAIADLQDQPRVLVTDQGVMVAPLLALVDEAAAAARAIVVVAPAFDEVALGFLVVNKLRGFIYTAAIEADADVQQAIAKHVSGRVISNIAEATFATLPVVRRVMTSLRSTVIAV